MISIGIIGCRIRNEQKDYDLCEKEFLNVLNSCKLNNQEFRIVSGGCPKGGDKFAELIATKYNVPIVIYKADWNKNGKSAGLIRNTDIAKNSDILIAVVAPDRKGGTEDTVNKFQRFHEDGKIVLVT